MELELESGDTITIPDGCRAVIKDKIITIDWGGIYWQKIHS